MKKGIALITVVIMLLAAITGCAGTAQDAGEEANTTEVSQDSTEVSQDATEEAQEETPSFTIGFPMVTTTTDPTSLSYLNSFKVAVEACGGTPVLTDWDWTPDGLITQVQKLISMDVDGIVVINMTDSSLPTVGKMCEEAGIPFVIQNVMREEIQEIMNTYEMFVGNTWTNDTAEAYDAAKRLAELGCKNIIVTGNPEGDMTGENRDAGVMQACEEFGMTILAEPRGMSSAEEVTKFFESAVAAYPEMDGILIETSATTDMLPSIMKVLEDHNLNGKVKVGKFDDDSTMVEYFESGDLSYVYGMHIAPMIYFETVLLCNTVLGTPLSDEPVYIRVGLSVIENAEEAEQALLYMANPDYPIYTEEETRDLFIKYYNPDVTLESVLELVAKYGLEDVMERHADLGVQ